MTQETPVDLGSLLRIAHTAVFDTVSPSAQSNVTDAIAAHAVQQYVAAVEQGEEIRSPNAWVATVARRRAIDGMRKWKKEKRRYDRFDVEDQNMERYVTDVSKQIIRYVGADGDRHGDPHITPWVNDLVETAIPDPVNREIAMRCLVDGEKPGAVALDLGLDPPVVSNRLARIKAKLRNEISVDDSHH